MPERGHTSLNHFLRDVKKQNLKKNMIFYGSDYCLDHAETEKKGIDFMVTTP